MGSDKKPCCASEALHHILLIPINRIPTGITMLDECIADVKMHNLKREPVIRAALLERVKVYNYIPPKIEDEYARALLEEYKKIISEKLNKKCLSLCDTMVKIEIVGTGCAKCKRLFANAEQAVKDLKIQAEVIKVDDIDEIVNRNIMLTPGLFINGKVRAEGRVPDVNEIKRMLME